MLELQTNAVATVSSDVYDKFRRLNLKSDLYTTFLYTSTSLMRWLYPRILGTSKDLKSKLLGGTGEPIQLLPSLNEASAGAITGVMALRWSK